VRGREAGRRGGRGGAKIVATRGEEIFTRRGREATRTRGFQLLHLLLAQPLDIPERFLRRVGEAVDRVHASFEQLLDVRRGDAVLLESEGLREGRTSAGAR
jgi:hypothetical protein